MRLHIWKPKVLCRVALVGVLAAACNGVDELPVADATIRECPHTQDWALDTMDERRGVIEKEVSQVTRGAQHVPEYNDCQRFITGTAADPGYGALYAIFAVPDETLDEKLAEMAGGDTLRTSGLAAAVIWSRGGTYPQLNIEPGFNCLVLSRVDTLQWKANVQKATGSADCSGPRPLTGDQGNDLEVHVVSPERDEHHYPTVARWGFDDTESIWSHYIAIKCGAAVCYIGPRGFGHRPPPSPPGGASPEKARRYAIALWHDEQQLATVDPGSSALAPSRVHGTIVPDPDLGRRNADSAFANKWVTVAEVYMSATDSAYAEKMYLAQTTTTAGPNIIQSCNIVGDGSCPGAESLDCTRVDVETGEKWRTRHIRAGDGAMKHFCVKRYPLAGTELTDVPAAARWRWLASDETTWHRCKSGCCDEQPT